MIGIDTNVLVRLLVADDHIQAHKAKKLLEQCKPVFVSTIVLCETAWVLESRYHFSKKELIDALEYILKAIHFEVENRDAVWLAFAEFQYLSMGFSDCVIGAIGRWYGCDYVATFDRKTLKSKQFRLTR